MDIRGGMGDRSPIYEQIIDRIKAAVRNPTPHSSNKLPAERETITRSKMYLMTVLRASEKLVDRGIIVPKSGEGAFASPPKFD